MSTARADLVVASDCTLGEGCLWDSERQLLYWVDIYGDRVFIFDPKAAAPRVYPTKDHVSTVVPTLGGELVLALRQELAWLDPDTGQLAPLASPEPLAPTLRFNDGKCDPRGRLWLGTMVESGPPSRAALYCISPELTITKALSGLTISNGLVWREQSFYHIDTPTQQIKHFDYDEATGHISGPRVIATLGPDPGAPDGMTIDEEGMLWVALWGGRSVVRIDPSSGAVVFRVEVPASHVTSCAFGGRELDELYITTAQIGLDADNLQAEPHAGGLFRVKLPFRGVPAVPFARSFR